MESGKGAGAMKSSQKTLNPIGKQEENYLARCTNFRLPTGYEVSICNCKHIRKMTLGERHSIVNPQRWLCNICLTTESVWACLSCPNVACGRYIQEHALIHYQETGHPLAIDVNELYVFCYKCDDYVLNDNNSSNIKVLRETLLAIRYENFTGTTRGGHTLRSATITEQEDVDMRRQMQQEQLDRDDRLFTAIWHSRFVRQRKAFRCWIRFIQLAKLEGASSSTNPIADGATASTTAIPVENTDTSDPHTSIEILYDADEQLPKDKDFSPDGVEVSLGSNPSQLSVTSLDPLLNVSDNSMELSSLPPSPVLENLSSSYSPVKAETQAVMEDTSNDETFSLCNTTHIGDNSMKNKFENPLCQIPVTSSSIERTSEILVKADNVKLVKVTLPSTESVKRVESQFTQTVAKTKEARQPDECNDDADEPSKALPPTSLNILSRPKRSTAALRYKEIFGNLPGCSVAVRRHSIEQLKKEHRLPGKVPKHKKITRGDRQSARIMKINDTREKMLAEKNKQKKKGRPTKLKSRIQEMKAGKATTKNERKVPKRIRTTSIQKGIKKESERKRRTRRVIGQGKHFSYRSVYDNIPNRAVASLIPGVTGLRNLGNTCYLNSIIQVLGHLQKFRRCLLALRHLESLQDVSSCFESQQKGEGYSPNRTLARRSTIELYEEQSKPNTFLSRKSERLSKIKAGLNGGQSAKLATDDWDSVPSFSPGNTSPVRKSNGRSQASHDPVNWPPLLSLCNELDDLYRVMWSGKWKLVSPYHFLHSVWSLIPSFRGYTQQDAQEFLCELLDKIVSELEKCDTKSGNVSKLANRILKVVQNVFEGRLMSRVRCLQCGHISTTVEPFWDLSLEFPQRYHKINSLKRKASTSSKYSLSMPSDICTLHEMLQNFTAPETLEGGKVYDCSRCNFTNQSKNLTSGNGPKKRLSVRKHSQLLTEAEKQIKVIELPQVLRFHLKRFRWIDRNHREKITVHVDFPAELDMRPYCWHLDDEQSDDVQYMYDLSAVVIHHGRGFSSGHYTANCWNDIGEFWVHCNDSSLELRSIEDVMTSQAYIIFYTQRGLDPHPHILSPLPSVKEMSPSSTNIEIGAIMEDEEPVKDTHHNIDGVSVEFVKNETEDVFMN